MVVTGACGHHLRLGARARAASWERAQQPMLIGGRTLGHDKDSRLLQQAAGHALRGDAVFWSHAEDTAQPLAPLPSFLRTSTGFCQDTGVRVFVVVVKNFGQSGSGGWHLLTLALALVFTQEP